MLQRTNDAIITKDVPIKAKKAVTVKNYSWQIGCFKVVNVIVTYP